MNSPTREGPQPATVTSVEAEADAMPAWLRWFANLGLSLCAAECALASVPVQPRRPHRAAVRRARA